jgi:hypothetical protein
MEKTIAKSIDGALNALALDKINTSTDYAHLELLLRADTLRPYGVPRENAIHL